MIRSQKRNLLKKMMARNLRVRHCFRALPLVAHLDRGREVPKIHLPQHEREATAPQTRPSRLTEWNARGLERKLES